MRRDDLCNELRQPWNPRRRCGLARMDDRHYRHIPFVVPPPPPTTLSGKLPLRAMARAQNVLHQRPGLDRMAGLDAVVSYLFVRQEALASSRLEGTWSTIDHVLTPRELDGMLTSPEGTASVRGYAEALERHFQTVAKRGHAALTVDFVKSLHKVIASKDPHFHGRPGHLRTPGQPGAIVMIGGLGRKEESVFNPAPPEHVARCLGETMNWFRDESVACAGDAGVMGMPLVVRLAVGHAHFEAVHPFSDGNGRVGRMLWPFQMLLAGIGPLYLSGYVEAEKRAYTETLGFAQKRLNYAPLIEFLSEAIVESHHEAVRTRDALIALPERWRARLDVRMGSASERGLALLVRQPVLTANTLAASLDVSFPAANKALETWVGAGIVRERSGRARDRVFAAEEVLAILGRRFGDHPDLALDGIRSFAVRR